MHVPKKLLTAQVALIAGLLFQTACVKKNLTAEFYYGAATIPTQLQLVSRFTAIIGDGISADTVNNDLTRIVGNIPTQSDVRMGSDASYLAIIQASHLFASSLSNNGALMNGYMIN